MKYPVYHAHKSCNQLKAKRLARFLAKPVAFTFLGMVLTAVATSELMIEQRGESDAVAKNAIMDSQEVALLPPPVVGR